MSLEYKPSLGFVETAGLVIAIQVADAMAKAAEVEIISAHKVDGLFTTHPSTQNRVAKLKAMAAVMHSAPPAETGPLRQSSIPATGRRGSAGPWR